MRPQFTPGQIRMLIQRAEIQFASIIEQSLAADPDGQHIARVHHAPLHETVVSIIKLLRDQVPGGADTATQVARRYAKGADARAGVPTIACLREIAELVRAARERLLPLAPPPSGGDQLQSARR